MTLPKEKQEERKNAEKKLNHYLEKSGVTLNKSLRFWINKSSIIQNFTLRVLQIVSEQRIRLLEADDEKFDKHSTPYMIIKSFSYEVIAQAVGLAEKAQDLGIKSSSRFLKEVDKDSDTLQFEDIHNTQHFFTSLNSEIEGVKAGLKVNISANKQLLEKLEKEYRHLTTLSNSEEKNPSTQNIDSNEKSESGTSTPRLRKSIDQSNTKPVNGTVYS